VQAIAENHCDCLFLDLIFFIFKIYLSYLFVNFFLYSRSVVLVVSAHTNKKRFLGFLHFWAFYTFGLFLVEIQCDKSKKITPVVVCVAIGLVLF